MDQIKTSRFSLQPGQATDVFKDTLNYLCSVRVGKGYRVGIFLFFKPADGRGTSSVVINIIKKFLEKIEINWENCTGLCTDEAQSMFGQNARHQSLVIKKDPHIILTHCLLNDGPLHL